MRIVLGIGGGIAAYKAAILLRLLKESGHDVVPLPTDTALRFVGAPTWEALSGHPVNTSVFDEVQAVNHVRQAEEADLVLIAPATADLLARIAAGRADDLLSATVLTAACPVVLAPAMHTQMWTNPATRDNVALLRSRGLRVIEPAVGRLTGADSGPGRLPEPADIARQALAAVSAAGLT
ncbi:flavoprotein, partial [Rothia kristinae]